MGLYIKGAEMPTTGIYQCSIDNSNGNDKTVMTVYKRKNDGEYIVLGTHEITELPPHGDLIDRNEILKQSPDHWDEEYIEGDDEYVYRYYLDSTIEDAPVIIPAEKV